MTTTPTTDSSPTAQVSRARRVWREHLRPFVVVLVCLFSFRSAIADWYDVPTGSMNPTIIEGDRIVVNKMAYDLRIPFTRISLTSISDPQRGDIVILNSPKDGMRLVKRLVAVPGDTVQLANNILLINGQPSAYQPLDSSIGKQLPSTADRFAATFNKEHIPGMSATGHALMWLPNRPAIRSFGPVTVPPGKYFMLGDNRDNSADSRIFGFVDRSLILGRSRSVAFSLDDSYIPRWSRFFKHLP